MRSPATKRRLLLATLLGCLAFLLLANPAHAQDDPDQRSADDSNQYRQIYRADDTWFFKGRLGLNFYGGDRDINPGDECQKYIEHIGFSFGLELGYSFTNRFSLSLHHLSGTYPRIEDVENDLGIPFSQPAYGNLDQSTTSKWRHHFTLLGRADILPNRRVSPYGQIGFNVSFGKINDQTEFGIAPLAGIGLDAAVTDRIGIFLELDGIFVFDDEALDLADTRSKETPNAPRNIDASDFDAFTFIGVGLRVNFKSPFVPVTVQCVDSPTDLVAGREDGRFSAQYNEGATPPVDVRWDFGDGATATGLSVTHRFANPGTYNVTVTASNGNGRSESVDTCPVRVVAPITCSASASPQQLSMCTQPLPPVQFTGSASDPLPGTTNTFRWDFGDGATSGQASPSHTYVRNDFEPTVLSRNAVLTVDNPRTGTATCPVQVVINPCPCTADLVFGAVSFNRNESIIPEGQARRNLQDNLQILNTNPSTIIVVFGFAQPNERPNPQALADDRARAVAQYYTDNGIDPSRVTAVGLVELEGAKTGPVSTQTVPFCDEAARDAYINDERQKRSY